MLYFLKIKFSFVLLYFDYSAATDKRHEPLFSAMEDFIVLLAVQLKKLRQNCVS